MAESFVILIAAHLIGDYLLQTNWIAENKRSLRVLTMHVGIVTAVTALAAGRLHPGFLLIVFATHYAIDYAKIHFLPNRIETFIADQLSHLLVIAMLAGWWDELVTEGWWYAWFGTEKSIYYLQFMTVVGGLILCVRTGGVLIGKLAAPLLAEIDTVDITGLKNGGRYIGYLERAIVLMLVLIDQAGGIGFLIAAKSVLRFGEIKNANQRKVAEYIIIGTFMSFGWALLTSWATNTALGVWG